MLELACPTAYSCLFKGRPGVLSKTQSHMLYKSNLPIFLFNVGLLTLIKIESADTQAVSASPQASQAVTNSQEDSKGDNTVPLLQSGSSQADRTDSQAISTSQASQSDSTDSQAVSASPKAISIPPQAVSNFQAGRQVINDTFQTGRQATGSSNPLAFITDSQGADTGSRASGTTSQAGSAGSQGASTTQANRQATRARGSSRPCSQNRGNTLEDPNLKWVINLSSKPLTWAQRSAQTKGHYFAVSPGILLA